MKLFDLLQKYGLINCLSGDKISWVETTASEAGEPLSDGHDFDCIMMNGFESGYPVVFASDAEVENAGVDGEDWVIIRSLDNVRRVFVVYKVLSFEEIV